MRLPSLVLAILLALATPSAATEDDLLTTIEGHVFNKFTGVPLEGAAFVITIFDELGTRLGEATGYSDSNGFYVAEVNVNFTVRLEVSCRTNRGVVTALVSPPRLGPEIVRRDAYLEVSRNRSFTACLASPLTN